MRAGRVATVLVAAALAPAALAAGCAAGRSEASSPEFSGVTVGMTAAEAESMAGAPLQRDADPADGRQLEVWYYEDGVLILENSRVKFSRVAPGA